MKLVPGPTSVAAPGERVRYWTRRAATALATLAEGVQVVFQLVGAELYSFQFVSELTTAAATGTGSAPAV